MYGYFSPSIQVKMIPWPYFFRYIDRFFLFCCSEGNSTAKEPKKENVMPSDNHILIHQNQELQTPNYELAKSFLYAMAVCENFILNIENQIEILEYRIFLEMKFEDRAGMRNAFTNPMDYLHEFKVSLGYWPHDTISMMHQIFMEEGTEVI